MAYPDSPRSDQCLFEALPRGDGEAFGEMIERHGPWLRGVVFSVLGQTDELDDVMQQLWANLWRRRGDLGEVRNWRNWLYSAARRTAIDAGRARGRRKRLWESFVTRLRSGWGEQTSPDGNLAARDELHRTVQAMERLPEKYRTALVLRVWQDFSYEQIAETVDIPVATVGTHLARARKLLRRKLAPRGES